MMPRAPQRQAQRLAGLGRFKFLKTKCKEGRVQDCQVENVTYPFVTGQGEFTLSS